MWCLIVSIPNLCPLSYLDFGLIVNWWFPINKGCNNFFQIVQNGKAPKVQVKFEYRSLLQTFIVRPVKRDWAVLSKDTPVDISI